jgi:uncharacterized protein
MTILLSAIETRVLGSLIEKEITTPEYYPLSLNALVNACNQKNNREPVMNLDEDAVRQALHRLQDARLAGPARSADGRVTKYEHWMQEVFNFTRGEIAVICVLLLRGPQTQGELRGRTERMYSFAELSDVLSVLQRLGQREQPLVKMLPLQPGTKEPRYAHLFSGDVESAPMPVPVTAGEASSSSQTEERVSKLEEEVSALQRELAELKEKLGIYLSQSSSKME